MDGVRGLLADIEKHGLARGHLLGLLHLLVGRRLSRADGTVVSTGLTWRQVAAELKQCRWDPEAVREMGLDPASFAPRDRQRFWYSAITAAQVGSPAAIRAADELAALLAKIGYVAAKSTPSS